MRVKELIEILNTLNQEAYVHAWDVHEDQDIPITHCVTAKDYVLLAYCHIENGVSYSIYNREKKISEQIVVGK
jgi:hypothetical protein